MPADQFFDTNILIYAFAAGDKRSDQAEALMAEGGLIGVQVLNEFTNVVRRKLNWDWNQVDAALSVIAALIGPARPLTQGIHSQALKLARAHTLSFYDALIIAAAADASCKLLLTEDLQHDRQFGGVRVKNPFLEES